MILKNKKILVTGATGGIGKALVKRLTSEASNTLCVTSSSEKKLSSLKKELQAPGLLTVKCDLLDIEKVKTLASEANEMMSGLDGVVCCAGLTADNLSIRMSLEDWNKVININLTANFVVNSSACSIMLKNRAAGSIVNVSSIMGITGNAGQANYSASKGGLISMTKSIALEFAARKIRVNCLAPGFVDTEMTSVLSDKVVEKALNQIPMKRVASPEEMSGTIMWLLGDDSSYVTGQVISVNGGLLM